MKNGPAIIFFYILIMLLMTFDSIDYFQKLQIYVLPNRHKNGLNQSYTNTIADWSNNTVRKYSMSREINFIRFIVTIIQTTFELPSFFYCCLWKDTGCILGLRAHTKVFPSYLNHLKDTKFWKPKILGLFLKNTKCELQAEKTYEFLYRIGL